jgi:aminopeptidase N
MSIRGFTDKSMQLEAAFGGWALQRRAYAEPGVADHFAPDRQVDITAYALELWIDPAARTLRGQARIAVRWLAGQGGELALDAEGLAFESVTDAGGAPLAFWSGEGKLRVAHADEIIVRWSASPRRGLYFVGATGAEPERAPEAWTQCQDEDAHHIFPCLDHPSVKHPWRVRVHAPEGFVVVGNGHFSDGEWVVEAPMPAYLFSVVVAPLDLHRDQCGELPVNYYVPQGTPAAQVRRAFGRTPDMINALAEVYGAYPWPRYDQVVVHDFIFGGMENLAATTLVDVVLVDDAAALDSELESLVVHELAHQWWGDLVTCQDWSQAWLNEGWATYTESVWFGASRGRDAAAWHLWEQARDYFAEDGGRYRRGIVSYRFKHPIDLFDRHIYEKGALVLHTLRTVLGDAAFWAGTRLYLERHAHQTVHTRHLQRAFEDASGRNLDGFFAQYVFGAGHPTLKVDLAWAEGTLRVAVKQLQEGEGVAERFDIPLAIAAGGTLHRLRVQERERTWELPCPERPDHVGVDSQFGVLAHITLAGPTWLLAGGLEKDTGVVGRVRAAAALAADGSREAIAALAAALRADPFWGVRAEVADLLASTGAAAALDALWGAVAEPDARVRRRVVAALGQFRREGVDLAVAALAADPSIHVRGEVGRVLGRLRSPLAPAVCEALLALDSWSEVLRARALEGLGASGDPAAFDTILRWTANDRPTRARAAAAAALARLADEVETLRRRAAERLVELAEDPNYRVQVAAIVALGTVREALAIPVLSRIHAAAGDARSRRLAWESLQAVREGRTTEGGLSALRKEVEGLVEENRKLRDRVGRLEGPR